MLCFRFSPLTASEEVLAFGCVERDAPATLLDVPACQSHEQASQEFRIDVTHRGVEDSIETLVDGDMFFLSRAKEEGG